MTRYNPDNPYSDLFYRLEHMQGTKTSVMLRPGTPHGFYEFKREWWEEFVKEFKQHLVLVGSGIEPKTKLDQFMLEILRDAY